MADDKSLTLAERAAQFVKQYEGFAPKAIWDVNAYRLGHGSDTITFSTLPNDFRKVVKGDTVTMEQADMDLARRIESEFFPKLEKQIGSDAFAALSDESIIALIDFIYNYGRITKSKIVAAAKAKDNLKLAAAIVAYTLNDNMGLEKANGWSKEKADKVRESLKARRKKESELIVNANSFVPSTARTTNNIPTPPTTTSPTSGGDAFPIKSKAFDTACKWGCWLFLAYCLEELCFMILK